MIRTASVIALKTTGGLPGFLKEAANAPNVPNWGTSGAVIGLCGILSTDFGMSGLEKMINLVGIQITNLSTLGANLDTNLTEIFDNVTTSGGQSINV